MTMTYKTIAGTITRPGSDIGIRARVTATPLTRNHELVFTGDDRLSVGPEVVETSSSGVLPTFKVPTNVDIEELYWRITAERLDSTPGVPKKWTIKNSVQITGTGTVQLRDLAEVDTIAVDAQILVNLSDLVGDAEDARDDAESAALDAEDSKDAAATSATSAAGSASSASTSAGTATTQAGNASSSATAADASADAAAASASHAEDMAGAAEAVAVSNDTIIAGRINDSASATAAALTASIDARVPAASTTVAGKAELATSAETLTGTDTVRAVTPAAARATFVQFVRSDTGAALTGHVKITVDPATHEITDIIWEA